MEGACRRKYERVSFAAPLEVRECVMGKQFGGQSIDISRGGIGFYVEHFVAAGSPVRVTVLLPTNSGPKKVQVDATIVWAKVEGEGAVCGAAFRMPLTPAAQPLLCEAIDKKVSADKG